jgi:COP9 signalosome complex subunit 7
LSTLELFAFENYTKYRTNKAGYLDLRPPQMKKLKMISVADAAQKSKVLHYAELMRELDFDTVRELEDLIIDCIYNELVAGQLDQLNQQFHVVSCFGRDLRP